MFNLIKNLSGLRRIFSLDIRTIQKCINMENHNEEGIFKKNNKSSKLDKYKNIIFEHYKLESKITDIKKILLSQYSIGIKYSTLKAFIKINNIHYEKQLILKISDIIKHSL